MSASGETRLLLGDVLVIVPATGPGSASTSSVSGASGDVAMQYRVSGYQGSMAPPTTWQPARQEVWEGQPQWCFSLPTGRMNVEVQAVNQRTGKASGASSAVGFLVRGMSIPHY
jgi:hypothetical protein